MSCFYDSTYPSARESTRTLWLFRSLGDGLLMNAAEVRSREESSTLRVLIRERAVWIVTASSLVEELLVLAQALAT